MSYSYNRKYAEKYLARQAEIKVRCTPKEKAEIERVANEMGTSVNKLMLKKGLSFSMTLCGHEISPNEDEWLGDKTSTVGKEFVFTLTKKLFKTKDDFYYFMEITRDKKDTQKDYYETIEFKRALDIEVKEWYIV